MKISPLVLITLVLFAQISAHATLDNVQSTIDQARAYLGEESRLNAVESIQYRGKVTLFQEPVMEGEVILTFQKPYSQKIEFVFPEQKMTTGFNGYEGYDYIEGKLKDGRPYRNIRSIGGDDLRRNKAAALENLSFFRPFRMNEDNTKDRGLMEVGGISAH